MECVFFVYGSGIVMTLIVGESTSIIPIYFQLVYEQDEVYNVPTSQDDLSVSGKLRIVERVSIFYLRCSVFLIK